jgi:hypothetical protein
MKEIFFTGTTTLFASVCKKKNDSSSSTDAAPVGRVCKKTALTYYIKQFFSSGRLLTVMIILFFISCKKDSSQKNGSGDILNQYTVSTLAGNGTKGSVDGPGTSAEFNSPYFIASDGQGNIYVTDWTKYSIRKISKEGTVTTVAGGSRGTADGSGANAQFLSPTCLTADEAGNIYVVDSTRIRKITSSGEVTTLAGALTAGYVDGASTAAQFSGIRSITVDKNGNVYALGLNGIYGSFASFIRKITPSGIVTTFIDSTQFNPTSGVSEIAADPSGNIFAIGGGIFEDYVYKISPSKSISDFATIPYASGLTINPTSGEIYITGIRFVIVGTDSYKIYKVTGGSSFAAIAGHGQGFVDGAGDVAEFLKLGGLTIDGQGNIYVADTGNNRIRKISKK